MKEQSEILKKITLTHLKEVPYWRTLRDYAVEEEVKEILIRFDIYFQQLGVEYNHLDEIGRWDPDRNYTLCEHQMHAMARLFGMDYNKDIAPEAYNRIKEWDRHIEEVHKKMEGKE